MEDNEKMVTSDDEDGQSSSNGEDSVLEERATSLEAELTANKYLYEVHVEAIDIYRKLADIKSMRAAYDRFSEYFPLTPSIWLAWIKDEVKLATSPSEKKHVLKLFQRAINDYLSVDVWLEYVQYCIGNCELEESYKVLEQGLSTAGLHANQGSLLWDLLRELELSQLALHEQLSEKWKQQVAKVVEAFKRQLSVPLMHMENTFLEWNEWFEKLPPDCKIDKKPIEWGYQQSSKLLQIYEPFEEQLLSVKNDEELYNIYRDYIKVITNPVTIICVYERAVTQLSLNIPLWCDYCMYVLNLGDVSRDVSKKAIRNCPWSEELWILHLRTLELQNCEELAATQCLEQGLASITPSPGLNLWLAYIEYIRRSSASPERLHKIIQQGSEHLGENGDPTFKLLRLQGRFYARANNMSEARSIWSNLLTYPSHKGLANVWLEFIALEKQYGDPQQLRNLYQRAVTKCRDWPEYIAEDWLMFERECGSLQDVLKCIEKCKNIQPTIVTSSTTEEQSYEHKKRPRDHATNSSKIKRLKIAEEPELKPHKTKVNVSDIDPEKSVFLSNMREEIDETNLLEVFPNAKCVCIPTDRRGASRCFAYVQFEHEDEVKSALERDREPLHGRPLFISKCSLDQSQRKPVFKYPTVGEENKLFVRGLPKRFSQDDVENIFKPHGCIAVRLVLHRSGQSKGLAYVEFKDKEAAEVALKATDQLDVEGFTITVAVSAPPQKKQLPSDELQFLAPARRSRLQLPLVPRSVQTKSLDASVQGSSKSNEDFRKMLSNKN